MTVNTSLLKESFREEGWEQSNARETIAIAFLSLMGVRAEARGHGTLNPALIDGFHTAAEDRFDLYAPDLDLYFEVTGTSWTRTKSAERCRIPMLPILKAKVDSAIGYDLDGKLYFISVNDIEGEVRFMPCQKAMTYARGYFEHNGGDYYMIPWQDWLKPCMVHERFCRAFLKKGLRKKEANNQ